MSVYYVFSMIVAIAMPVMLIAVMVAGFLLLLQAIKYFKKRNSELERENVACIPADTSAPCCCETASAAPETEEKDSAE